VNTKVKEKITARLPALFVLSVLMLGAGVVGARLFSNEGPGDTVSVTVPKLSAAASLGSVAYDANCAQCHGVNGAGTPEGPPLVHDIYNPGHHADKAFYLAVQRGVREHHWPYGNMPRQPQVTEAETTAIIRYVRELQEANGIFYRQHTM
jgi:mono/diheme cytochrome c family protein